MVQLTSLLGHCNCSTDTAGQKMHQCGCPQNGSIRWAPLGGGSSASPPNAYQQAPRYGWICPKCEAVMAPGMPACTHCKPKERVE